MSGTNFTKEHLITCLSSKEGFKNVKPYIAEVEKENEHVYEVLSKGMTEVLTSTKIAPIAKLQAVKLFKDIFETAEFNCIEDLDEKIENAIYRVAAYKKDSKDPTRGQSYFIEVEKRPDNEENRQFGLSYHLFAMESIKNYAEWYPKDFEGEVSRFKEYYDTLKKEGVVFPEKCSYFKLPDNQQKFRANYRKWLKKEEQRQDVEEPEAKPKQKVPPPKQKQPESSKIQGKPGGSLISNISASNAGGLPLESMDITQTRGDKLEAPSRIPEPPPKPQEAPSRIPEPVSKPPPQESQKSTAPKESIEPNVKVPAIEAPRPVPAVAQKSEYDLKLQKQLETSVANLEKLRSELQEENLKLKGELADKNKQYEQKLEAQQKQIEDIRKRLQEKESQDKSKSQLQPLEDKIKKLEAEAKTLTADLNDKTRNIKLNEQRVRELEEQLKKKEAMEGDLRSKLAEKKEQAPSKPATPAENNAALQKLQRQNEQLQEKLALSSSAVDSLQGQKRATADRVKTLETDKAKLQADNSKLVARCSELEKQLQNALQQSPHKEPPKPASPHISPARPQKENGRPIDDIAGDNKVKRLPRYEGHNAVQSTEKRMRSLPKTEKYGAFATQEGFYMRKAANLEGTPNRKVNHLNRTEDWHGRPVKLSEMVGMRHQADPQQSTEKPINNRLSIFGFRDLEGEEVAYEPKLFAINGDLLAFRKTCINQQSVFFENQTLRLKLSKLGGTSEFNLLITNVGKEQTEVQFELNNNQQEQYRMTKVEFKAYEVLQPGKSLSENFIVKPVSLSFRYPNCTVGVKDKPIVVNLPITMLSLSKFLKLDTPAEKMFFSRRTIKSECFQVDPAIPDPKQFFSKFLTTTSDRQEAQCTVSTTFNRDITLILKMIMVKSRCVFQLSFQSTSDNCQRFARTLLQVLMFCWKGEQGHAK